MFEAEDYKQMVLEILWDGKHMNRFVCELRLTLFINALDVADTRPACLMPFPHFFYDSVADMKDVERLKEHISTIPPLDDIKVGQRRQYWRNLFKIKYDGEF